MSAAQNSDQLKRI